MHNPPKKPLLFLIESLSGGGAEKVLTTLLRHLDSNKFDVTLCCIVDCGKYINDVKPYVHYTSLLPNPEQVKGIRKLIYQLKYKLIYSWLPLRMVYRWFVPHHAEVEVAFVEGFATKLLAHSTNQQAKMIAWVHTDLERHHWTNALFIDKYEEEHAYKQYDQIITVSTTVQKSFIQTFPAVKSPVEIIYNPIDSEDIINKGNQKYSLPNKNKTRLISIGRLTKVKAYSRLLHIATRLQKDGYAFELWILGDGEEREMLQHYIQEKQLEKSVTLWGFQTNPYAFMAQSDLFVCSSISEGYSTAVTEALILGLPVVTTACSGMGELLKEGECGIITDNSEDALLAGIKQLLDHPEQLAHYKEKATARGKEFTLEALMKPIETVLKQ